MNNGHNDIGISAILLLSIALLFSNVQQGYGSSELNEESATELYKLEQLVKAEQTRDKIFALTVQQNPYLDISSNTINSFEENDNKKSSKAFNLRNENFQLIKDAQISIAEKKSKEILGGKTILNFIDNDLVNKKSIHNFIINNQTGFMNRASDDFQNYKLLQISNAETLRDKNWKEFSLESNPYRTNESRLLDESSSNSLSTTNTLLYQILIFKHTLDNSEVTVKVPTDKVQMVLDSVSPINVRLVHQDTVIDDINVISPSKAIKKIFVMDMLSNNEENQNLSIISKRQNAENQNLDISLERQNDKFNNLIIEQISLAENIRDEIPEFKALSFPNPYLNKNNVESLDKTNANLADLTFVDIELTREDRGTKAFEMIKAKELEIAQNTLNEMLFLSDSKDVEITNLSVEKINDPNHDDLTFEILKNEQIKLAQQKLFELYGHQTFTDLHDLDK